jgi:hypothetical protein
MDIEKIKAKLELQRLKRELGKRIHESKMKGLKLKI